MKDIFHDSNTAVIVLLVLIFAVGIVFGLAFAVGIVVGVAPIFLFVALATLTLLAFLFAVKKIK